jgi:hypothetical protein
LFSDGELADEFVRQLRDMRYRHARLVDELRQSEELQALLEEFRDRLWARAEEESAAGGAVRFPRSA